MAIHQWGFQWQAITRLLDSSACCLCCFCSLGPQLPNSPWKQYLYIYYIFTQYLPCCKTISYLTINLPVFFFPPAMSHFIPPFLPHLSLYICPFFECFFFIRASISLFSEGIFLPFFLSFFFALYIDEIGFFCSPTEDNHSSNCHLIAKFHSTVKERNTGERALKKQ